MNSLMLLLLCRHRCCSSRNARQQRETKTENKQTKKNSQQKITTLHVSEPRRQKIKDISINNRATVYSYSSTSSLPLFT
jgi:hypothetical protein